MKKTLIAILAVLALISCNKTPDADTPTPVKYDVPTPTFAKGADVSWLSEMEHDGKTFAKKDGTKADCFAVLKDCGVNSIRLRVWVNPTGGWSGKEDMIKLAVRAAKADMAVMVDFHYSDFFCDPLRQTMPSAWEADKADVNKIAAHVKAHTTDVLNALKEAGVTPAWIQIGNETRNGMLWPIGKLWATSGETRMHSTSFSRQVMKPQKLYIRTRLLELTSIMPMTTMPGGLRTVSQEAASLILSAFLTIRRSRKSMQTLWTATMRPFPG